MPAVLDSYVAEAERDAVGGHTHVRAAEVLVEPVHDEPALYLLTHAAGDHDDDGEDDGVAGRLDHCLERIVGDVVEPRHERQHESEKQHHRQKDHGHEHDAE